MKKRILVLLTVVALMVVMLAMSVVPALALDLNANCVAELAHRDGGQGTANYAKLAGGLGGPASNNCAD
jgi:hypothetical protein